MEFSDRLYRNRCTGSFVDITTVAGIQQGGFGQGATIGDFDSDGFPDIFTANIGPNHLLRNNGDGTLTDITDEAGITGNAYTTSCLMVDLERGYFAGRLRRKLPCG